MTNPEKKSRLRIPMSSMRKTALIAGIFYLLTFLSIPAFALYGPVRGPNYILGSGSETPVILGAILEMIVALACIGTAVTLYPVLRRQDERRALGFVGSRILEAATIYAGIVNLLSIVTLRQAGAGVEALSTNQALAAMYYWTFHFGQGFIPAVNAILLGSLLYQSRLVPRALPILGFIGAAFLVTSWTGTLFGLMEQSSPVAAIAVLPIAVWEFSLGIYLIVKGFKPSTLLSA